MPPPPKTPPQTTGGQAATAAGPLPPIDISSTDDTLSTPAADNVSSPAPELPPANQGIKTPDADAPEERPKPVAIPAPPVVPPIADVIVPPRPIQKVAPVYPGVARAAQLEGNVVLEVTVGTDGTVNNVVVVKSPHTVLDDAARKAVMQYRYSPGHRNGVPEAMHIQETVLFQLR